MYRISEVYRRAGVKVADRRARAIGALDVAAARMLEQAMGYQPAGFSHAPAIREQSEPCHGEEAERWDGQS